MLIISLYSGINDGEDFDSTLLEDLYDRIVTDEIRMKEDGALFPHAVKKVCYISILIIIIFIFINK